MDEKDVANVFRRVISVTGVQYWLVIELCVGNSTVGYDGVVDVLVASNQKSTGVVYHEQSSLVYDELGLALPPLGLLEKAATLRGQLTPFVTCGSFL